MDKYSSYKPSGIEWLETIPENWEVSKLKYLGNLFGGLTGKSGGDFNNDENPKNKPYIPYTNIFNNTYISKDHFHYVSIEDGESQNRVKKNDMFFLMSSETHKDLGKSCILIDDVDELYLNSFCKGYRIKDKNIQPLFLNYQILGHLHREMISVEGKGFTRINLRQDKLNDLFVFYPPLQEQEQIVKFLDEKTTIIDKLISTKQRKVELLKEQRTSLINEVITKGLNPNVKMKDSGVEWVEKIPDRWETSKLKYNGLFFSGYSFDSGDFLSEGKIRVIKISNIQNNGISWEDLSFVPDEFYEKHKNFIVNKGDLIFVLTRPIISTGIKICFYNENYQVLLNQRNSVFRTNPNKLNRHFTYYLVRTTYFIEEFKQQLKETNQPNISSEQISNIRMFLPPILEQQEIVDYLDKHTKEIDDLVSMEQKKIELLKEYRQSLISEVITGKIKVVE